MTVGFIGNFEPPFSTENDRKWSLLMLGINVITFQENKTTKEDLLNFLETKPDALFYSHTHGWEISGLVKVFETYREHNIPTVSVHLDRWAWLARESDVGNEATWFTQYQFMADGSPEAEDLYKKLNLNWFYLKPGVVARDCYMAAPDPVRFPHEIIFIGSRGYHPEYPFRATLVDWLHQKYGERFGHYGNDGIGVVRGHDLNVLLATAKIVVGDSCFGGRPNYVSDRYYETRGRGGFLLHPFVDGVDHKGVRSYEKENLNSLEYAINHFVARPEVIEFNRREGFNWVKGNETYTDRMKEVMETIL